MEGRGIPSAPRAFGSPGRSIDASQDARACVKPRLSTVRFLRRSRNLYAVAYGTPSRTVGSILERKRSAAAADPTAHHGRPPAPRVPRAPSADEPAPDPSVFGGNVTLRLEKTTLHAEYLVPRRFSSNHPGRLKFVVSGTHLMKRGAYLEVESTSDSTRIRAGRVTSRRSTRHG